MSPGVGLAVPGGMRALWTVLVVVAACSGEVLPGGGEGTGPGGDNRRVGRIEISVADDFEHGAAETVHWLDEAGTGTRYRLELAEDAGDLAASWAPGSAVAVTGDLAIGEDGVPRLVQVRPAVLGADDRVDSRALVGGPVGDKRLLYVRVTFPDAPIDPVGEAQARDVLDNQLAPLMRELSYDQLRLTSTVTPLLLLPQPRSAYTNTWQIQRDALVVAAQQGYDPAGYDLDAVIHPSMPWYAAGEALVGHRGLVLNGYAHVWVIAHELGHNLGLWHASRWHAHGDTLVGPGTMEEYGHFDDVMGSPSGSMNMREYYEAQGWLMGMNAAHRERLGWFRAGEIVTTSASGRFLLPWIESPTSGAHVLQVVRPDGWSYWLEYRRRGPAPGLFVVRSRAPGHAELVDLSPWDDQYDPVLDLGRTFSDPLAGIHVTPVGTRGTSPDALDVVVNVGTFAGNRAPTLSLTASKLVLAVGEPVTVTASASDADGDALAYAWQAPSPAYPGQLYQQGPHRLGGNQASVTTSFAQAGKYRIRCVVTDMKGKTAWQSVLVTVGGGWTRLSVSGQVTIGGQPVAGARVSTGFTDDDGRYVLDEMFTGTYELQALHQLFAGPAASVTITGDVTGLDWVLAPRPSVHAIAGTVVDNGQPMVGVTVTAGGQSTTTDATGAYRLTALADGFHTVSVSKPGYAFSPATRTLALWLEDVSRIDFTTVPGTAVIGWIYGATGPMTVTDGYRTALSFPSGSGWYYQLYNVPPGTWTLSATGGGQTAQPDSFTNPVTTSAGQSFLHAHFRVGGGGGGTTDTSAPTVAITSPASGTTVVQRSTIAITAGASDDRGVSQVTILVNGQAVCTDAAAPYQCSWKVPGGRTRQYTMQAIARDAAGNTGQSSLVTVYR
jgi:hypothetical protein